jgi:uncharacterized protein (TIGR02246 family)
LLHLLTAAFWHLADIPIVPDNVRFWENSGHRVEMIQCPLLTQSGPEPVAYTGVLHPLSSTRELALEFAGGAMTDDEQAIRELVLTWMKASEAGDVNTVLSLMTDDMIFMVPGREPFGKEEFRAASEGMKNVRLAGTSDIREIKVLGDWAYIRNYIEITVTPPDGTSMQRRGYTLSILRKQSYGKWALCRDANLVA